MTHVIFQHEYWHPYIAKQYFQTYHTTSVYLSASYLQKLVKLQDAWSLYHFHLRPSYLLHLILVFSDYSMFTLYLHVTIYNEQRLIVVWYPYFITPSSFPHCRYLCSLIHSSSILSSSPYFFYQLLFSSRHS